MRDQERLHELFVDNEHVPLKKVCAELHQELDRVQLELRTQQTQAEADIQILQTSLQDVTDLCESLKENDLIKDEELQKALETSMARLLRIDELTASLDQKEADLT